MAQPEVICLRILEERMLARGRQILKNREPGDQSPETAETLLALEIMAEIWLRKQAQMTGGTP